MPRRAYLAAAIGFITALLCPFTALAEVEPELTVLPGEGWRGDNVDLKGTNFAPGEFVDLYFSRDEASVGEFIDTQVTHYWKLPERVATSDDDEVLPGEFRKSFDIPDALDSGSAIEDVRNGGYYFYATYRLDKEIVALAGFSVLGGEMALEPEVATVGTGVTASGQKMRPNQTVTIEYDGEGINIKGGNQRTDSQGNFSCTFIAPERPAGDYTIRATDQSGDTAETEFRIIPQIALDPPTQDIDQPVAVSGNGFAAEKRITVLFETEAMATVPAMLNTNRLGSLGGSFTIPPLPRFVDGGVASVTIRDEDGNSAVTELTVLAMPASVSLSPATSLAEPGYVGMQLRVSGIWFLPNASIDIVYDSDTIATAQASESRYFSASFTIPPGVPGSHTVTASDGVKSVSAVFTMEREKPAAPLPLLPEMATSLDDVPRFDWEDVSDPSGVGYTLQVGADNAFKTLVLEKSGITASEYTVMESELFRFPERDEPYYWRVKAVDGTATESGWSVATAFYIARAPPSGTGWLKYLGIALGAGLAVGLIIRWRKKRAE